jgi:hypothetical protein
MANPNWVKGKSGNPLGRPKSEDTLSNLIRLKTKGGQVLIEKAMALLNSSDEDIQAKMIVYLSERGWGKPTQPIDHTGQGVARMVLVFPGQEDAGK